MYKEKYAPEESLLTKQDETCVNFARNASGVSKDPNTKVGAVIYRGGKFISKGCNNFPRGVKSYQERFEDRATKYKHIVHAEANAIINALNANRSLKGASIYIYKIFPCEECAKLIIQSGIRKVFTTQDRRNQCKDSELMLKEAGVEIIFYKVKDNEK